MGRPFLFEKFRGINNVLPEDSLYSREDGVFLRTATNVDIDNAFKVRRRKGYRRILSGQIHSLWSDGSICLFREGTALKRFFEDYSTQILRNDLGGNLPMSYLSVDERVYCSDGITTCIVDDGRARTWGMMPPPTPDVQTTVGEARPGWYYVCATYVRSDGQESGTEEPVVIILDATGGLTITLTASEDPDVNSIRLYASAPDGDMLFQAGEFPNQTARIVYSGSPLGGELKTLFLQSAPAGHLIEHFLGKVYVAAGPYVFPSKAFGYELFDLDDYLPFDGIMTLLGAVEDGLFMSDGKKTYFVEDGKKRHSPLPHAAIPGTMVKIDLEVIGDGTMRGQGLMWASDKGIILGMKGGETKNLSEANYVYPPANSGMGLFRQENGINQYIALLRDGESLTDRAYTWQKITSQLNVPINVAGT